MHPQLRRGLVRAVANPTHLVLASTAATAALLFVSWWPLLLGLMGCMLLTAITLSSPALWRALAEETCNLRLVELEGVNDPGLQNMISAFGAGRSHISQVLAETPEEVKLYLGVALSSLDQLEDCAARLVLRAQELAKYLQELGQASIEDEVRQLSDLAQRTQDPETWRDYDCALSWQKEQLQVTKEVALARERAVASLLRTIVVVKGLPARILGLRLLDENLKDSLAADLNEAWDQIRGELQSTEQILKGLNVLPPRERPAVGNYRLPAPAGSGTSGEG